MTAKADKRYVDRQTRDAMVRGIKAAGLTQTVLADKLDVSRPYLTRILSGKAPMARVYVLAVKFILLEARLSKK